MSDDSTTRMLEAYIEQRSSVPLFLSSFFSTTPRSFHDSEFVEVDVRRSEPRIALPVPSIESGARKIELTEYTNKKLKPPVYDTEFTISAFSTTKRRPGATPFEDPGFRRAALDEAFRGLNELEDMTRRAVELQVSQIFQTGVVTLKDDAAATVYSLDYGARPSHFLSSQWKADGTAGDPNSDIDNLATLVRQHGKLNCTDVIFGAVAWQRYKVNAKVKAEMDNRILGPALYQVAPADRPEGATYMGRALIGKYWYNLWQYDGYFLDPVTQDPTPYVGDKSVILVAAPGVRRLTFGSIPMFAPPDTRAAQFLPARMSSVGAGFDMTTNAYITPDGKHLTVSAGTRPLAVPVALDTTGCITVTD